MTSPSASDFSQSGTRTEHAYAKINLLLRVLARGPSGYHEIETLFQRLALHDVVRVTVNAGPPSLHCSGPAMPSGGLGAATDNLAWHAAESYARQVTWLKSWQITIEKHIPVGGGMGGGSADAAAVLRALDSLAPVPLGSDQLLEIGGRLGSDVPFLVSGGSRAWAWNRGDRMLTLPSLCRMAVILIAFDEGVSTAAAYGALAARRAMIDSTVPTFRSRSYSLDDLSSWETIGVIATNDFEPVVAQLHPGVQRATTLLRDQVSSLRTNGHEVMAMMSGSGPTCFLLCREDLTVDLHPPDGARVLRTTTF